MSKKEYDWANGANINSHSKIKLKVLDEYFREYLRIRCVLPQQGKFRLAIVDGFCGAGLYNGGSVGSPIIFLRVLKEISKELNVIRVIEGFKPLDIECSLYFNDLSHEAISLLQNNIASMVEEIAETCPRLSLEINFSVGAFEENKISICESIKYKNFKNLLFNLDQYGYTQVSEKSLAYLMGVARSTEIFLTFAIESFLTYLTPSRVIEISANNSIPFTGNVAEIDKNQNKKQWLGSVEKIVFEALKGISSYVSPFSIHNPNGWRYWLIHFANSYKARQVYNDVLHKNKSAQAHFGRSGLNMLYYNPNEELNLYLFDRASRSHARNQLDRDIPNLLEKNGGHLSIHKFYSSSYNQTPAHSDDINFSLVNNPDLQVVTSSGGTRRSTNTIKSGDFVRLRNQRSFFSALTR
ncbi:three-Cys-motif partner protein TcmP [Sphingomonas sp. SRS2]|uniref:three-Cys-motif partner protein TcmP n=1 Tax=Sphingomonas sp. SRS2 TaxID=133190 RepID=UPI000B2BF850|nr:three-Cys-motif partner protein TcmP [Sphingomonas sp. SRS2]